ncbi:hypothetical protein SELMODRAFT_95702 [Selaginella moellendorffii]|uniref:Pentacotripeptide-repeat region of PRORP domain-containing protein n=1 Tax=Selaginella moellendorffii TaxID=88036 RepID=D8RKP9_SELML|nr:hypothetical protein SELMODRAFT_95702 [Selaginella moellendorffii]
MPFKNIVTWTTMIVSYAEYGQLEECKRLFEKMPERDIVAWTALMSSYAQNGHIEEAKKFFNGMPEKKGLEPNSTTMLGVLTACCHMGLLDESQSQFLSMKPDRSIEPGSEHYCCMITLLGTSGKIRDAEELVDTMPFQPDVTMWTSLLGCSKIHGDATPGERAARQASGLIPRNSSPYLLLSSMIQTKTGS